MGTWKIGSFKYLFSHLAILPETCHGLVTSLNFRHFKGDENWKKVPSDEIIAIFQDMILCLWESKRPKIKSLETNERKIEQNLGSFGGLSFCEIASYNSQLVKN